MRHLPFAFEEGSLLEISCESFEAYISKLIKINTNNQEVYTTFRLLEKSHEEKPKITVPNGNHGKNKSYRSQWLKTYKRESIEIDYEPFQVALLLKLLKKHHHYEGEEWKIVEIEGAKKLVKFENSPLLSSLSFEDSF